MEAVGEVAEAVEEEVGVNEDVVFFAAPGYSIPNETNIISLQQKTKCQQGGTPCKLKYLPAFPVSSPTTVSMNWTCVGGSTFRSSWRI